MRNPAIFFAGATLGALAVLAVESFAAAPATRCSDSVEYGRIAMRFDDLEQTLATLQTQSTQAAASAAAAHANAQSQLARISSQVADVNVALVSLSGRVRP